MSYNPPLMFGPIAPESNPPIEPQYFEPSLFNISSISNGLMTTVTTTTNHNFVVGQLVRLLVPMIYGSFDFNEKTANVIFIPASNQVVLALDSQNFNTFVPNPTSGTTQPQIAPVGDINTGVQNASGRVNLGTTIPGAFENISP